VTQSLGEREGVKGIGEDFEGVSIAKWKEMDYEFRVIRYE
jgi:hypothetical protein